jgi:hypothetical protein
MNVMWLHEDESAKKKIHNLYSSSNVIKKISGHGMGGERNLCGGNDKPLQFLGWES